jgi:hypothetical protein
MQLLKVLFVALFAIVAVVAGAVAAAVVAAVACSTGRRSRTRAHRLKAVHIASQGRTMRM